MAEFVEVKDCVRCCKECLQKEAKEELKEHDCGSRA